MQEAEFLRLVFVSTASPIKVEDPEISAALILWTNIQHYPLEFSPGVISFLELALTKDPAQRPSADELMNHPWVKSQIEHEGDADGPEAADHRRCAFFSTAAVICLLIEQIK